ncbi:MAG TPA: hypothetical protein PK024_10075 [Methanospirillum sp.]|uniref:hypothetical protein n=1 Tax=Methanospirillum sp. TaxID=45200 RepID=UPI002C2D6631|nr:hypothetical protein [Methanospirillum sp.]HOJ97167.1 hypothetical protein [Methanospirillum sp.]HPP79019.1 hypothetical protein [Methanospirillum sp.]
MVLEEEIWFSTEEQAQECLKMFKKLNITAHLKTKVELKSRIVYKAPFTALKGIIEEEIEQLRTTGEEEFEEYIQAFEDTLKDLINDRDLLAQTIASHAPGDHISTTVFDVIVRNGEIPDNEDDMVAFFKEATITQIMGLNDLLDIDEEGMILKQTIAPDEAVMSLFGDELPPFREEALRKWKITRSLEAQDTSAYTVVTGPDIIFLEDLNELDKYFQEIDEEAADKFLANLQVKQVLVAEILSMIQKEGRASKEELMCEFIHKTLPIEENALSIGFHLSPGYLESVLNDLKKMGMVKGKDSRLKVVV